MTKNIIKQIQAQIKAQNHKLTTCIKDDIARVYKEKDQQIKIMYEKKENKLKKAYTSFINKLTAYKSRFDDEQCEIRALIDQLNERFDKLSDKRKKISGRLDKIKSDLVHELKKEIEDNNLMKNNINKDIDNLKKKTNRKIVALDSKDDLESIKEIFSSIK
ncbi:hypothetical protein COBT_002493 [Conglomerata obtusa]